MSFNIVHEKRFFLCRYRIYMLKKLAIAVDEIRSVQNKPCNLKVNSFCVFMLQYSQSPNETSGKLALIEYMFTFLFTENSRQL